MARGDKTKACAVVYMASIVPAFMDPTGLSALVMVGSGTGLALGGAYHATRKTLQFGREIVEEIQEKMEDSRNGRAQASLLNMPPSEHIQFQYTVEETIRRLATAMGGVVISGVLFVKLPISGIAFFFSLEEAFRQARNLKGLADRAGGCRQLIRNVSLENVAVQAAAGVAIRAITTFMFMGTEFYHFMDGISHMANHFTDQSDRKSSLGMTVHIFIE